MSKHERSGDRSRYKNHKNKHNNEGLVESEETGTLMDSATIQRFKIYSKQLDEKNDKFERIVKLSRDITIKSKRIIFLMHTIVKSEQKLSVLTQAEIKLRDIIHEQWQAVAKELDGEDPYLFHRAFTPGMQEFMEAYIFYNYLNETKLFHWDHYQKELKYNVDAKKSGEEQTTRENPSEFSDSSGNPSTKEIFTILVPADYILGLADATGELMRKCIYNLGTGDFQECFDTCNFVKSLYSEFLTLDLWDNREMSRKLFTLRQSLLKMEMVCYNIHVRGNEVPKYMLGDVDTTKSFAGEDEGYED